MAHEIKIKNWKFDHVCQIAPSTDQKGTPVEFLPQDKYDNKKGLALNRYGKGPFCKFSIDRKFSGKSGVYAISINGEVRYVGECADLHGRFSMGYGNISPRNCFQGGQSTNCRINSEILKCYKSKARIQLYFLETENRFNVENSLIAESRTLWNKTVGRPSRII